MYNSYYWSTLSNPARVEPLDEEPLRSSPPPRPTPRELAIGEEALLHKLIREQEEEIKYLRRENHESTSTMTLISLSIVLIVVVCVLRSLLDSLKPKTAG